METTFNKEDYVGPFSIVRDISGKYDLYKLSINYEQIRHLKAPLSWTLVIDVDRYPLINADLMDLLVSQMKHYSRYNVICTDSEKTVETIVSRSCREGVCPEVEKELNQIVLNLFFSRSLNRMARFHTLVSAKR